MFASRLISALWLVLFTALSACAPAATPATASTSAPAATSAPTSAPKATALPAPTATSKPISLRIAILLDEGTLQPYTYVTGYPGWNVLSLVYDTLFIMDADNLPKPWLAK